MSEHYSANREFDEQLRKAERLGKKASKAKNQKLEVKTNRKKLNVALNNGPMPEEAVATIMARSTVKASSKLLDKLAKKAAKNGKVAAKAEREVAAEASPSTYPFPKSADFERTSETPQDGTVEEVKAKIRFSDLELLDVFTIPKTGKRGLKIGRSSYLTSCIVKSKEDKTRMVPSMEKGRIKENQVVLEDPDTEFSLRKTALKILGDPDGWND